jgi:ABC-type nitrate/sulfonate/bicarbonate transport system permease component
MNQRWQMITAGFFLGLAVGMVVGVIMMYKAVYDKDNDVNERLIEQYTNIPYTNKTQDIEDEI